MRNPKILATILFMTFTISSLANDQVSNEINETVWELVSKTVVESDIDGMASVYHPDAVLVAQKGTNPIASVLEGWGKDMEKMHSEGSTAAVSFKFGLRQDNDETAFESGLFRYVLTDAAGTEQVSIYEFESLLVKKEGQWKILMERQIREVDQTDWSAQP
jgi:ketosteroid isomerase-like protein